MSLFDEIEKLALDAPAAVRDAGREALTVVDRLVEGAGFKESVSQAIHGIVDASAAAVCDVPPLDPRALADTTLAPRPGAPASAETVNLASPAPAAGDVAPATGA